MNLEEVKEKFPESANEIEALESLGFASRSADWIDSLNLEKAQTACWLVGRVGNDQDGDVLVNILLGQRRELWMQAATSLNMIGTEKHVTPLLSLLANRAEIEQQVSAVYALSSIAIKYQENCAVEVQSKLVEVAANPTLAASVRGTALESLTGISREICPDLYQRAVAVVLEALDDSEAEVRFWACFAVAGLKIREALNKLQVLVQTDRAIVPGWWSVGEEAEDAIAWLNGGDPPLRRPRNSSTT
jgi:HEAT repeat protein